MDSHFKFGNITSTSLTELKSSSPLPWVNQETHIYSFITSKSYSLLKICRNKKTVLEWDWPWDPIGDMANKRSWTMYNKKSLYRQDHEQPTCNYIINIIVIAIMTITTSIIIITTITITTPVKWWSAWDVQGPLSFLPQAPDQFWSLHLARPPLLLPLQPPKVLRAHNSLSGTNEYHNQWAPGLSKLTKSGQELYLWI